MLKGPVGGSGRVDPANARERKNWLIHLLYVRQEFDECMKIIDGQLRESRGLCEYAIFVKVCMHTAALCCHNDIMRVLMLMQALIQRQRGQIQESLTGFQAATCLNPHSATNLKQVWAVESTLTLLD